MQMNKIRGTKIVGPDLSRPDPIYREGDHPIDINDEMLVLLLRPAWSLSSDQSGPTTNDDHGIDEPRLSHQLLPFGFS
jgi:hypothetical protein